jgi:hypothetical protein
VQRRRAICHVPCSFRACELDVVRIDVVEIGVILEPMRVESGSEAPCPGGEMLEIESDCRHVGPSCRWRDSDFCVGTGIDAAVSGIDPV